MSKKLVKKYTYKSKNQKSMRKRNTRKTKKGGDWFAKSKVAPIDERTEVAKQLDDCLGIIKSYNPNLSLPDTVKQNYKSMHNKCLLLRPKLEEKLRKLTSGENYVKPFDRPEQEVALTEVE
jgi:hypothetical protein